MTLKILTIDDDPMATTLVSLMLQSYGMDVITANNGATGIQMAREESPDLVMLDMTMPEMDGLEVCKAIRSFSKIPILAYSAINDFDMMLKAKIAGVTEYFVKPTPSQTIVECINKLVKKGHE
jgi:CheY-like chemotaxis protein